MKFAFACVAVCALLTSVGCGRSSDAGGTVAGWKEFDPEAGKFSIKMPGDAAPLKSWEMAGMKAWGAKAGDVTYRVGYQELPMDFGAPDQARTDQMFDNYLGTLNITEDVNVHEPRKAANVAQVAGAEITVETPDKKFRRIAMCISGGRIYRADVTGSADAITGADPSLFFNSFKIGR